MSKKLTSIIVALVTTAVVALSVGTVSAAASTLSVTPAAATVTVGNSFNVSIIETGDNVNVVTVNMTYDASKLTCTGVGGGAFASQISATCGGGNVNISRYVTPGQPGLNGSQVVGTLSFKAIATGSAKLNFGASQVASAGVNTLSSSTGGTYTIVSAPMTSNPGSGSGSSTSGTVTYGPRTTSNAPTAVNNPATTANPVQPSVLSDTSKDEPKEETPATTSSDNDVESADKAKSNVGRNILVLLVLAAVAGGIVASQRYRAEQAAQTAAAATAAKKAKTKKTPAKKKAATKKKTTKK